MNRTVDLRILVDDIVSKHFVWNKKHFYCLIHVYTRYHGFWNMKVDRNTSLQINSTQYRKNVTMHGKTPQKHNLA